MKKKEHHKPPLKRFHFFVAIIPNTKSAKCENFSSQCRNYRDLGQEWEEQAFQKFAECAPKLCLLFLLNFEKDEKTVFTQNLCTFSSHLNEDFFRICLLLFSRNLLQFWVPISRKTTFPRQLRHCS